MVPCRFFLFTRWWYQLHVRQIYITGRVHQADASGAKSASLSRTADSAQTVLLWYICNSSTNKTSLHLPTSQHYTNLITVLHCVPHSKVNQRNITNHVHRHHQQPLHLHLHLLAGSILQKNCHLDSTTLSHRMTYRHN